MDDDFIFSEEDTDVKQVTQLPWTILVVDDDKDVHITTTMSLKKVMIHGRPLNLLHVDSGQEAKDILKSHTEIDLILLDMIMETNQAGLEVARWLREDIGRRETPIIILRTGQPGLLSNEEIMENKHFDYVLEKTTITRSSLIELLTKLLKGPLNSGVST